MNSEIENRVRSHLVFAQVNFKVEKKFGMSVVQYLILHHIQNTPGITPQVLAENVGMQGASITPLLQRLNLKKWIMIGRCTKDHRKKRIVLTAKGFEKIRAMSDHEILQTFFSADENTKASKASS